MVNFKVELWFYQPIVTAPEAVMHMYVTSIGMFLLSAHGESFHIHVGLAWECCVKVKALKRHPSSLDTTTLITCDNNQNNT